MRVLVAAVATLMLATSCEGSHSAAAKPDPVTSPLAGASALRSCGGEESPIPQFSLAVAFDSVWVACRTRGQVLRLDPETGAVVARIPARGVVSLAAGDDAVWGIHPGRRRDGLGLLAGERDRAARPRERGGRRLCRRRRRCLGHARIACWLAGHLPSGQHPLAARCGHERRDAARRDSRRHARAARARRGHAVGRGPRYRSARARPADGKAPAHDRGRHGTIDLAAAGDALWVAVAPPEADRQGLPGLERLVRIDPQTGEVAASVVPTRQVDVTGLAGSDDGRLWISDVVAGAVLRVGWRR